MTFTSVIATSSDNGAPGHKRKKCVDERAFKNSNPVEVSPARGRGTTSGMSSRNNWKRNRLWLLGSDFDSRIFLLTKAWRARQRRWTWEKSIKRKSPEGSFVTELKDCERFKKFAGKKGGRLLLEDIRLKKLLDASLLASKRRGSDGKLDIWRDPNRRTV